MKKLLWMDLEMTGLKVDQERIIEAAAIVTDLEMNELAQYHAVVKQDQKFIDGMDEWNVKHHGESGLIDKIPFGKDPALVEKELIHFISEHFQLDREDPVLSGNSIHQDRRFIDRYWPGFADKLSYRMLDVSSWKVMFKEKYAMEFHKSGSHKALDDVRESIAELQYYMGFLNVTPEAQV